MLTGHEVYNVISKVCSMRKEVQTGVSLQQAVISTGLLQMSLSSLAGVTSLISHLWSRLWVMAKLLVGGDHIRR